MAATARRHADLPKQQAPIRLRKKQGNSWYSHPVENAGKILSCKATTA